MNQRQLAKLWAAIGLALAFYAIDSWIVTQGDEAILKAKLVVKGRTPVALLSIPICSVLLIATAAVRATFAKRSRAARWHRRMPVAFFDEMDTGSVEGRLYHAAVLTELADGS